MGNIITCVKRIYNIQMPNGIKMEVESEKPLSGASPAKLLEDDCDISSFLENIKILDVMMPQEKGEVVHRRTSYKKTPSKKLIKAKLKKKALLKKIEREGLDSTQQRDADAQSGNRLNPCDRINIMIAMQGEFTRLDYQKFMEEKGYKMSNFMGHGDIEDAIMLKRIIPTGEKIGRHKKYRIVDVMPVEQYMYRKILKSHRDKMKY